MDAYEARFSGIARLFDAPALERLRNSHVMVIGLGGVGSWAVEALARSGIGQMTLVDLDDVCISNVNRQIHAVEGVMGKPKVEVMAHRVMAINPDCRVNSRHAFFLKSNASEILTPPPDFVVDAIDSPARKCLLIALCRERGIAIVTTGASAGRRDPTRIEVADLANSTHDRLLQEVRKKLRVRHGFPRDDAPFGIECVLSRETPTAPAPRRVEGSPLPAEKPDSPPRAAGPDLRLDCDTGFGTASFVTGCFGLVAASLVVRRISAESS